MMERVVAQAQLLCGELDEKGEALLKVLCQAACVSLEARLKEGISPLDCQGEFIAGAGLLAVAGLYSAGSGGDVREFKAGDLTIKGSSGQEAALALKAQAEGMLRPFLKDGFVFVGV